MATKIKPFRLLDESLNDIQKIKKEKGFETDTEAVVYALNNTVKLIEFDLASINKQLEELTILRQTLRAIKRTHQAA